MRFTRKTMAIVAAFVSMMVTAAATADRGVAAAAGVQVVPLASALAAPVPVEIGVGHVALLDVAPHRVAVVATSDPAVAHAIVRGTSVLLVALRPGTTTVGIGLGGTLVASFRVTVADQDTGLHAVRLEEGGGVSAAAAGPTLTSPPVPARAQGNAGLAPARAAAQPTDVSGFVAGLTDRQRAALAAYLRDPSLDGLAALLRALTPPQQAAFMRMVAGGSSEMASAVGASPVARQAAEEPHGQAAGTPVQASDPAGAAAAPAGIRVSAPEGVRLTVVPTWTGPVLSLSYVLQNNTGHALRADPNAITVSGAAGDITVRQLDLGEAGLVGPGGVETGVIVLTPTRAFEVGVQWPLGSDDGVARAIGVVVLNHRSATSRSTSRARGRRHAYVSENVHPRCSSHSSNGAMQRVPLREFLPQPRHVAFGVRVVRQLQPAAEFLLDVVETLRVGHAAAGSRRS
jgi:hypothetical protein